MADPKGPDDVLRDNWAKASRLTLSAAASIFILSRGAKSGASKILEAFGLDWSSLNPYAVALFGVPTVAVLSLWSLWLAHAFARRHAGEPWHARVVTKGDLSQAGAIRPTMAAWSVLVFVVLPLAGLASLEDKFLSGTFYFSTTGGYSCPEGCVVEGQDAAAHLVPAHGLRDVLDTPYRYEGNLTYLPPWQPIIWLALGLAVALYAARYAALLARSPTGTPPTP